MADLVTQSPPWILTQLRPSDRGQAAQVALGGSAAPHGRRRKTAITDNSFELRLSETYYPGVRSPTWTHFGDKEDPLVLRGRLMDRDLGGAGTARSLLYAMKNLTADGVECFLRWGDVISYVVMPGKLRHAREDATEVAYEWTLHVGEDFDLVRRRGWTSWALKSPSDMVWDGLVGPTRNLMSGFDLFAAIGALAEDIMDAIAGVISTINSISAFLLHATEAMQDFESAVAGQIGRLLGGIQQYRTAWLNLVELVDSADMDGIMIARTADAATRWQKFASDTDVLHNGILQILADLEDGAHQAEMGGAGFRSIIARDGDTWESIAQRELGSASQAGAIMDANGIQYGEKPIPGRTYIIPTSK